MDSFEIGRQIGGMSMKLRQHSAQLNETEKRLTALEAVTQRLKAGLAVAAVWGTVGALNLTGSDLTSGIAKAIITHLTR
jgi:hypothetical protein